MHIGNLTIGSVPLTLHGCQTHVTLNTFSQHSPPLSGNVEALWLAWNQSRNTHITSISA